MTNEIYIENANDGFEYVNLTCSDDKVNLFYNFYCMAKTLKFKHILVR